MSTTKDPEALLPLPPLADTERPRSGTCAFHCHILSHAEDSTGMTGMVTAMVVK